jgi:hypothetical protein
VRADFYSHCAGRAELVEVLRDAQATLGSMSTDEPHRAVVRPAARVGCRVEGRLLVHLIAQAQGHVAILPLLSHALLETWRRRRGTMLTLTGFQAVGGIEGALARTAEAFHGSLDPDGQAAARRLFLRLTALGRAPRTPSAASRVPNWTASAASRPWWSRPRRYGSSPWTGTGRR